MKKISTTTAKKFRKMQKLTFGFRTEVANQVAAPAETRNTQLAASKKLINDCGWKGGDSGKLGKGRTLFYETQL